MKKSIFKRLLNYDLLNVLLIISVAVFLLTSIKVPSDNAAINTVYWISALISILCIWGILKTMDLKNLYDEGGKLGNWYMTTFGWKGTQWLNDLFDCLISEKIIKLNDESFIFISPTANVGKYEKALFRYASEKNIQNKFIASDLNEFDKHEQSEKLDCGEFIYLEGSHDARQIESTVKEAGEDKVDAIFDLMGYTWHIREDMWQNKKKCIVRLKEAFEIYNGALKENGIIILDNVKELRNEEAMRHFINLASHYKIDKIGQSTGAYLLKMCGDREENELKDYINKNFKMHIIDGKGANGREISSLVLQKISGRD